MLSCFLVLLPHRVTWDILLHITVVQSFWCYLCKLLEPEGQKTEPHSGTSPSLLGKEWACVRFCARWSCCVVWETKCGLGEHIQGAGWWRLHLRCLASYAKLTGPWMPWYTVQCCGHVWSCFWTALLLPSPVRVGLMPITGNPSRVTLPCQRRCLFPTDGSSGLFVDLVSGLHRWTSRSLVLWLQIPGRLRPIYSQFLSVCLSPVPPPFRIWRPWLLGRISHAFTLFFFFFRRILRLFVESCVIF